MVALGDKIAGLMGNDDAWVDAGAGAADRAGEPVWPLPLPKEYRKLLESEVADLKNIGAAATAARSPPGCSSQEFVDDVPVGAPRHRGTGACAAPTTATSTKGGTGFGVRTLVELAQHVRAARRQRAGTKTRSAKPAKRARRVRRRHVAATCRWRRRSRAASRRGCDRRLPEPRVPRRAVDKHVVTIHIRDNFFVAADLERRPRARPCGGSTTAATSTTSRRATGDGVREPANLKPGRSYARTFDDAGQFAYYCTLHGTPTSGQHAELAVGDATVRPRRAPRSAAATHPRRRSRVGPHDPRARGRADHPGRGRPRAAG